MKPVLRLYRWTYLLIIFWSPWIICVLIFVTSSPGGSGKTEAISKEDFEAVRERNAQLLDEVNELKALLKQMKPNLIDGPSKEYEMARKVLKRDVKELWNYLRATLETAIDKSSENDKNFLNNSLEETRHRVGSVLADIQHMQTSDGFESWRHQESKVLNDLVQAKIHALQNPGDCKGAKKLVCNVSRQCGYGCRIHHAVLCFIVAYGTERMVVLNINGWPFKEFFRPLSETCSDPDVGAVNITWPGNEDDLVVKLTDNNFGTQRPKLLPPAIPRDLSDRIIRLHGDPSVWWVSQFLKYMLRPQPEFMNVLKEAESAHGIEQPIVGVHIRRTDKVRSREAALHRCSEYMKYVEDYYTELAITEGQAAPSRRVYVASDDPSVLEECRKDFPEVQFFADERIAASAKTISSRYQPDSLRGIITDIHLLSRTDFLVCTFSSNVCRLAYEIMQQYHPDAADRFQSLDDIWFLIGQDEHQQEAVMHHKAKTGVEIDLKPGDVISVAGNHWNGFNKGRNHRTHKVGLYPLYKTREKVKLEDFPTYPKVVIATALNMDRQTFEFVFIYYTVSTEHVVNLHGDRVVFGVRVHGLVESLPPFAVIVVEEAAGLSNGIYGYPTMEMERHKPTSFCTPKRSTK